MGNGESGKVLLRQLFSLTEGNLYHTFAVLDKHISHLFGALPPLDQLSQCIVSEALGCLRRVVGVVHDEPDVSVESAPDDSNFELHQVHGECACFVSKHVLNLAKFLVERG